MKIFLVPLTLFSKLYYFIINSSKHKLMLSRTKRKVKIIVNNEPNIRLEIGSGGKKGTNGWLTLDLHKSADIWWDLRNGIPFPTESIIEIYSSHLFEHLNFKEINALLQECLRVLRVGGKFSICVPDASLYINSYSNSDYTFWNSIPSIYSPAYNNTTKIDMINYMAYMDGHHKYMFDLENLLFLLNNNGFIEVKSREYNPEIDLKERNHESIYAIGMKGVTNHP